MSLLLCHIFTNLLARLYRNINFRNVNVVTPAHPISAQSTSSAVTSRSGTASYPTSTAVCVRSGSHSNCASRVDVQHEGAINCRDIIKVVSPTDAQLDSLKNNIKFALKLTLKISYMFRCKTPSSGSLPSESC